MQAIHFAAQSGLMRVCQILVEAGANPQVADDLGVSAWDHLPSHCRATPDAESEWNYVFRSPAEMLRGQKRVTFGERRHRGQELRSSAASPPPVECPRAL